jgi:hypothetical protein
MVENQLAEAVEKYKDVIKIWIEGNDPFKKALAETVLEAVKGEVMA